MSRLKRVLSWGCLIVSVASLCFFLLGVVVSKESMPAEAHALAVLLGFMAVVSWRNLRKPPQSPN